MRKLISILLCFTMLSLSPTGFAMASGGDTYYVSPDGKDENPGTEAEPWRTISYAASRLQAGDTAIVENGLYEEENVTRFYNSGEESLPITLKAENAAATVRKALGSENYSSLSEEELAQHTAVIKYVGHSDDPKMGNYRNIDGSYEYKDYIKIDGFHFTQDAASENSTSDIYIDIRNSVGCSAINNVCTTVFEEGIKARASGKVTISDNVIIYPEHEGIDVVNCYESIISGNEIIESGRTGIMVKGNSRNSVIYNNYVENTVREAIDSGYTLGGSSDAGSVHTSQENVGYEAYNLVAYNNIAYSENQLMKNGIGFFGAKDCYAYNNIIIGAQYGFVLKSSNDTAKGWGWNPVTENPVLYNNVIVGTDSAVEFDENVTGLLCNSNCYYNNTNVPVYDGDKSTNYNIYLDPCFTDAENGDFTVTSLSPLRRWAGESLPATVSGFKGFAEIEGETADKTVSIPQVDYNGNVRETPIRLGVYNMGKNDTLQVLAEDFESYPFTEVERTADDTDETYMEKHSAANPLYKKINSEPWNDYIQSSTNISDSRITVKKETASGNQYCSVLRTVASSSANPEPKLYRIHKTFSQPVSVGKLSLEFKFKAVNENAGDFLMHYVTASGSVADLITIKEGSNINGVTIEAGDGDWYNFEYIFDFDNDEQYVYVNGSLVKSTKAFTLHNLNAFTISSSRKSGADGPLGEFAIDDMYVTAIGTPKITSLTPVSDELAEKLSLDNDLKYAEVTFSNNIKESTITSGKVLLDDVRQSAGLTSVNGSRKHFLIEFDAPLDPGEARYDISFDGIGDLYGAAVDDTAVLTTREARVIIGNIEFYSYYNPAAPLSNVKITSLSGLSNASVTAAVPINNETAGKTDAALILVHKGADGKIKKTDACDASVVAETSTDKFLEIHSVSAGDTVEAYLWDGIKTMQAIAPARIITSAGNTAITPDLSKVIDTTDVNVNISNIADSTDMKMTVSGTVAMSGATVNSYVLKPDASLGSLTFDNFSASVDFAGQTLSGEGGSYSFDYVITNGQNGKTYTAYAGGNDVATPSSDSAVFFDSAFVTSVIAAVNGATAEQIAKMLADEIYVPNVSSDVYLNSLLKLDLTAYNSLKNYTTLENFRQRVSEALEAPVFVDINGICTAFNQSVTTQTANQNAYIALLAKINADAWSQLEKTFTDNTALLHLPWTGSYASIKNNSVLLETFYKKLANEYTFTDFDMLRTAFEDEAKKLIPPADNGDNGGGGSSGGGGGGSSTVVGAPDTSTPIPAVDESAQSSSVTFTDLDTVPWAQTAIESLAKENILSGVGKNRFEPNQNVTREAFVKMAVMAFDLYDENSQTDRFIDVKANSWYEKYVASAVNSGIIYGMDNTHFGVGKEISRAEMAVILHRVCLLKNMALPQADTETVYTDNADIPAYARDSVNAISAAGIMNGVGDSIFAPQEKATRAMAARVIWLLRGEK